MFCVCLWRLQLSVFCCHASLFSAPPRKCGHALKWLFLHIAPSDDNTYKYIALKWTTRATWEVKECVSCKHFRDCCMLKRVSVFVINVGVCGLKKHKTLYKQQSITFWCQCSFNCLTIPIEHRVPYWYCRSLSITVLDWRRLLYCTENVVDLWRFFTFERMSF